VSSYSDAGGMPKSLSVLTVRQILLLCVCALVLLPGAAGARTWPARFVSINDGDTIDARVGGRVFTVRLSSMQAMEQHTYSSHPSKRTGECNAVEATTRLEHLIHASHGRLRLSAQDPRSRAGARLRRWVAVRVGGRWRDTGEILIREGHALWMPGTTENAMNRRYNEAEQQARLAGTGLWDPTHCGAGPHQDVPLKVWVNSDPAGVDTANLAGEWVKIQNQGTTAVPLAHWWVRDSMLRRLTFPGGAVLAPGHTVTVYTGPGTDSAESFHWQLTQPMFENADGDGRNLGDGAYLFDPQGDLRAAMVYPCLVQCSDPNQGAVALDVQPRGSEYVRVRNTSDHAVDLYGYELALRGSSYPFGPSSALAAGQSLTVDLQGDPGSDSATTRHWGFEGSMLRDGGGFVRLTTFDQITLACDAWGSGSC
jgi:endonuclease YncB( thermonuclease family)